MWLQQRHLLLNDKDWKLRKNVAYRRRKGRNRRGRGKPILKKYLGEEGKHEEEELKEGLVEGKGKDKSEEGFRKIRSNGKKEKG